MVSYRGGSRPVRLKSMRSSRENALPLLSSGVSSKAGPEWRIYSGSVLVIVVSSFFLRIVLYPLGLFLGTGPELVSSPVSYERYSGCLRVKSKDHGVR